MQTGKYRTASAVAGSGAGVLSESVGFAPAFSGGAGSRRTPSVGGLVRGGRSGVADGATTSGRLSDLFPTLASPATPAITATSARHAIAAVTNCFLVLCF